MAARIKILLIDDEVSLCRMIKLNLERSGGYDVATAFSGEEGIDKAKAEPFDLVITDFNMPGMNGRQVVEALKAFNPRLPVILASVYHDDLGTITPSTDRKADGLISKPIDHAQLEATIQDVLSRGRGAGSPTGVAKKQILIIDDEVDFGRLLKMNVERAGEYEAILAANGREGVERIKMRRPDLVLLDINMPVTDGFETLKQIKVIAPDLPVAMVTACWNEEEARKIMEAGAFEYITKPVDFEYLKNVLLVRLFS